MPGQEPGENGVFNPPVYIQNLINIPEKDGVNHPGKVEEKATFGENGKVLRGKSKQLSLVFMIILSTDFIVLESTEKHRVRPKT